MFWFSVCQKRLLKMVFLNKVLCFAKYKKPLRKYTQQGFIDSLRLIVKAGAGGNGYPKFGGIGGQGGSVYAIAKNDMSLEKLLKSRKTRIITATSGRNSTHNFILGTPGNDEEIVVPVGVTVYTELGKKLGELNVENEKILIAKGGTGGHPKNGYLGTKGQEYPIKFYLKLIADIGLVGFPNAGKSTLLKLVSHANPKIASYPFTTIRPNVGVLSYPDYRQITMADLPGLIEGAHANRGMGHEFLRHVERTKLLLLVVDINGFQLSPRHEHRSCLDTVILLNKELELYNQELLNKPAMLILNKMDVEGADEIYKSTINNLKNLGDAFSKYSPELKPERPLKFEEILPISAKSGEDSDLVKNTLRKIIDITAEMQRKEEENSGLLSEMQEQVRERGPRLV